LFVGRRILARLEDGGIVDARIQGSTKLVQHLAKLETNRERQTGSLDANPQFAFAIIVHIHYRCVWLFVQEFAPCSRRRLTMDVATFDSLESDFKWLAV